MLVKNLKEVVRPITNGGVRRILEEAENDGEESSCDQTHCLADSFRERGVGFTLATRCFYRRYYHAQRAPFGPKTTSAKAIR